MNKMIEITTELLKKENLTCVIADKTDIIFKSSDRGIKPLLEFINLDLDSGPFSLSDKIIGKAAALLCIKAGITEVHAYVMSTPAIDIFKSNSITYSFDSEVSRIMNRTNTGLCPMECLSEGVSDPETMLTKIQNWITSMKSS